MMLKETKACWWKIVLALALLLGKAPAWATGAPWVGNDFKGFPCQSISQNYGPFNYLDAAARAQHLARVEDFHFTQKVESLQGGETSSTYDDLAYTVNSWPNHHRALYALIRLFHMSPGDKTITNPPECWLQRAMNFVPEDATLHMLMGVHLHKSRRYKRALVEYDKAIEMGSNFVELHYNRGLTQFELKQFDAAAASARKALARGYPLEGLMRKLKTSGHWRD